MVVALLVLVAVLRVGQVPTAKRGLVAQFVKMEVLAVLDKHHVLVLQAQVGLDPIVELFRPQ